MEQSSILFSVKVATPPNAVRKAELTGKGVVQLPRVLGALVQHNTEERAASGQATPARRTIEIAILAKEKVLWP
jgi:hypothetical protein